MANSPEETPPTPPPDATPPAEALPPLPSNAWRYVWDERPRPPRRLTLIDSVGAPVVPPPEPPATE